MHDRFGPQQNVVSKLNVLFWSKVSGLPPLAPSLVSI